MHNLKLIQRRFPNQVGTIVGLLIALSASALAIGVGLLFFQ
jgi:hypothetical protein